MLIIPPIVLAPWSADDDPFTISILSIESIEMFCIGARASVPGFSSTPSSVIFVWLLSVPLVKIDVNCPIPPLEVILIELIAVSYTHLRAH